MSLESRYRRLLLAYPRSYRRQRGDEMVATLMETAGPDQNRPTRHDIADVIAGGLRERLGLHAIPGLAVGLRVAGPIGLALAAGLSASDWLQGVRTSTSTVAAAVWLLAALVWAAVPRLGATSAAVAWIATLSAAIIASGFDGPQPGETAGRFAFAIVCGLIAVLGLTGDPARSPTTRASVVAAIAGMIAATVLVNGSGMRPSLGSSYAPYPDWTQLLWLLPVVLFAVGLAIAVRHRMTGWLWAGLILLVPVPLAVSVHLDYGSWYPPIGGVLYNFSGLALSAFACALLATSVHLAARHNTTSPPRDGRGALASAGALCLGLAGGLCGYVLVGAMVHGDIAIADAAVLTPVVFAAVAGRYLPVWLLRGLMLFSVGALVANVYTGWSSILWPESTGALVLLLIVTLATLRSAGPRTAAPPAATVTFAGFAFLSFDGSVLFAEHASTQSFLAPVAVGVVFAPTLWWAMLEALRSGRGQLPAVVTFSAALLWLLLLVGPAHDARVIGATVGTAVVVLLAARLLLRRGAVSANG